jgi:hypothetical protein
MGTKAITDASEIQNDLFGVPIELPPGQRRLTNASVTIATDPPDDINYQHSILCQVGLPRSKLKATNFERRSQNAILSVEAGKLFDGKDLVQQFVPYGPKARLALGYIHTAAIRTRSPIVSIGDSTREFLGLIGLRSDDGRTYKLVRQQLMALAACRFTLGYFSPNGSPSTLNTMPVKRFELWSQDDDKGQRSVWPGVIELRDEYFNDLIQHGVPYDPRAYAALAHSALSQDVYLMLCYRLHRLNAKGVKVTWKQWQEQFGQEYNGVDSLRNFKDRFIPAVKDAIAVYPDARVEIVTGGLMLKKSEPAVSKIFMDGS